MEGNADVPAGAKMKLEFQYDWIGWRIVKKVWRWDTGAGAYGDPTELHFLYDGWNLIQEMDGNNNVLRATVGEGNLTAKGAKPQGGKDEEENFDRRYRRK